MNVSSIYGIISPPGQSAYSASKFAVRGFSNALGHELEGSTAEQAAGIIVRGIERRQARILVGGDAKIVALLERLSPVHYWKFLKKATGR